MFRFIFLFFLITGAALRAQTGHISGTIVDAKTGETLPGAMVLVEGTNKGASADFDGKFTIHSVPVGKVTLVFSYISYTSKKIQGVEVKANEVSDLNIGLEPSASSEIAEVEVVVTLNKENNTALVLQQKNSGSVSDGVSAETIRRTPDRNTSDVLKRVSGVTIQDDKFVVVRGLNERYNSSYLNGAPLPSTEPDKKAFAFDLFPANMLDNIVVYKTATPDLPSEFAGGIIQVNTKSIPEKNFVSFNGGLGYNAITTFKTKTIYEGGKFDKLGFDDGSRDLPAGFPTLAEKSNWISNSQQAEMAKQFKNDWAYQYGKFKPNSSAQFAAGYNFKRQDRDFLGVVFSLGYYSTNNLYTLQRTEYEELDINGKNNVVKPKDSEYLNTVNQTQTSTGALLNLSMKLNDNNSLSLKNLFSGSADNKFITSNGTNNAQEENIIKDRLNVRYFSANRIYSSQLTGDHFLPVSRIKINWNTAVSSIQRTVPNMRFDNYGKYTSLNPPLDPSEPPNLKDTIYKANISTSVGPDYAGYRVYSELNETMLSGKLDVSRLVKFSDKIKIDFKAGTFIQERARQFNIRSFGYNPYSAMNQGIYFSDSLLYLPTGQIFAEQNMGAISSTQGGFKLSEGTKPDDNYAARSSLKALYGMGELKFADKLRIIAGMRYESYFQKVNTDYGYKDSTLVSNTVNDLLPSVNFIYNLTDKMALRLAYYKTLNRPEFRELAVTNWYDPETRLSVAGNPNLKRCFIQNFDVRFEVYPGKGQLFTISGFYKYFDSPIERYMYPGLSQQIYYKNANYAQVYGTELEYRINLGSLLKKDSIPFLNNLSLFSNLALIKSEVNVKGIDQNVPDTRPMQGQAPYIVNTGLSYIDPVHYYSLSLMVNRVGQRLNLVGSNIVPNRWEIARTVMDLQVTKSFLKNKLEFRFNIRDLLHQDWIMYYKGSSRSSNKFDPNADYINFKRNYGSTYSFVIGYRF
ncbi:MAG TPA: TonB-dependent receptor [Bacteroidia bacterium]|nr:TonB-dependent receptor [Bacteroidia bacterium]